MNILMIIFGIVLMLCAAALIVVVVLQTNRGSEMSAITGHNSNASGKGQSAKRELLLKRLTVVLGMVFIVAVLVMNLVVNRLPL